MRKMIQDRLTRLEAATGVAPIPPNAVVEELTDDQLAQVITGGQNCRAADLSSALLEGMARGGREGSE